VEAVLSLGFFDPAPFALKFQRGFDDDPEYQMVPLGGTRDVGLQSFLNEPGDVFVFVNDRGKANIKSFIGLAGVPPVAQGDGLILSPNSGVLLTIEGLAPGRTKIVAEAVNGGRRRVCRLSVKPRLSLTYQLGIISDGIHVPDKTLCGRNLQTNMLGAERIWLSHANVELKRVGAINDVKVAWNLNDPIVIDDPIVTSLIAHATVTKDMVQAHLYIYGTWDVVYHNKSGVAGSTTGNLCFIENASVGRFGELLCAHEVGHAIGLHHPVIAQTSQLMNGDGISDERLLAGEIEISNPL
jgi:hypothetical protein